MMEESQCHFTSFGIGRPESNGRKQKSVECSTKRTVLAKTLEITLSIDYYFCIFMTLPLPSAYHGRLVINGEPSLISHTPGRKQAPVQGKEIFVMLPPVWGKEAILNDYCCSSCKFMLPH